MNLEELKKSLGQIEEVTFVLPNGGHVPPHFHATEVGKSSKHYADCGGTVRKEEVVTFQLWSGQRLRSPDRTTKDTRYNRHCGRNPRLGKLGSGSRIPIRHHRPLRSFPRIWPVCFDPDPNGLPGQRQVRHPRGTVPFPWHPQPVTVPIRVVANSAYSALGADADQFLERAGIQTPIRICQARQGPSFPRRAQVAPRNQSLFVEDGCIPFESIDHPHHGREVDQVSHYDGRSGRNVPPTVPRIALVLSRLESIGILHVVG